EGKSDRAAVTELLQTFRTASNDEACRQIVEHLNRGAAVQSVWDALHVAAGELLMRQPAIVALHAVTSTNALHYAFQESADDETRRLLLLQNAAFLTMFRDAVNSRGRVNSVTIEQLSPAEESVKSVDSIFAALSKDPMLAARKVVGFLKQSPDS